LIWRKLTQIGTRYSEVLNQARFDVAGRMLQDPNVTVADVAYRLGYSSPAHFARAFQRIAGVTPRVYRQAYSH
jgi:AraC-like DNA-binding protein